MPRRAPILLFDVNETLLDLGALDPMFHSAFGDAGTRPQWFLTLQTLWMTGNAIERFQPFDQLARAALEMTARRTGRQLAAADRTAILDGLKRLPPHDDVAPALDTLASCGVRLAALTNGTAAGVTAQLRYARIDRCFEAVFSVEAVRRYKPAPEPYRYAARLLRAPRSTVDLVSVHPWDIAGARAAGLFTIFVGRPGHPRNPADRPADIEVGDLADLARNIAARRRATKITKTN